MFLSEHTVQWQYTCGLYFGVSDCCQLTECSEVERNKGLVLPCLIYYMDRVSSHRCRELLERLEPLVFADYHLIYKFVDHCDEDIKKLHCGRTDDDDEKHKVHAVHTRTHTAYTPTQTG